jgi:hypothetical protein
VRIRFPALLAAGAATLSGCFPYESRVLTERESLAIERMCSLIRKAAKEAQSAAVREVGDALSRAHRDGNILVFDGEQNRTNKDGFTARSTVYLRESLLQDAEDPADGLLNLFHEGVHLTQSWCGLVFAPDGAEREADRATRVFADYLRLYGRRIFRDDR